MKCPRCNRSMKNMMHFEDGKDFAYNACKHCQTRTHQRRIHYEEFEKGRLNEEESNKKHIEF